MQRNITCRVALEWPKNFHALANIDLKPSVENKVCISGIANKILLEILCP
jgi:hypothetical protein